jgi:hypothetical protein
MRVLLHEEHCAVGFSVVVTNQMEKIRNEAFSDATNEAFIPLQGVSLRHSMVSSQI